MNSLRRLICLLSLLAGVAFVPASRAQGTAGIAPDHVIFYTEPNFKGEALTVEAGASVDNLASLQRPSQQPWLSCISSVQVVGAATATVYSAAGFGGERLEISRTIPDLFAQPRGGSPGATWDRAIVSLVVRGPKPAAPPPTVITPAPPVPVVPGRVETPPPTVVVVQPPPPPPAVVVQPARPRLDRRTAEMLVERAYREVLDRPADPEGLRRYRDRLMHDGWSEREVIEQLQRSPEARAIKADEAITKIYREVLGRDPDPNGLAHYRSKWRQGWTQGQIREDLRRSHEGRDTRIREVITRAYREVLGRDPDPAGYANYERLMRERGYTERDIRRALMGGDEYRQRMRK
ncbi:MAG: DUF4214 domain-containing protein [Verrucomicrobia bacterium]|nr:DUF4214 domain-containing protein [Verrucomicrobiota bacterium]